MARGRQFAGVLAACFALAALVPALAAAGSISGTVTDEDTHAGIAGIEVCLQPDPYTFEVPCVETAEDGTYVVSNLLAASYSVRFSAWSRGLNYVQEWNGGDQVYPGDLVAVGASQAVTGIDAELEAGGAITGIVTDAGTGEPAAGVWVCVEAFEPVFYGFCQRTNSVGDYEAEDLPSGEYRIEFNGENDVNYLKQFYKGVERFSEATPVSVTAGSIVTGIGAELHPGAQIFGTVTEAGTGTPLAEIEVCLYRPVTELPPEYVEHCTHTGSDGSYAIRSLFEGAYRVVFSQEGEGFGEDTFTEQWWNGAPSVSEATTIHLAPPDEITGIDAQLVSFASPPLVPAPETGGNPVVPPPPPPLPPVAKKPLPKCKKGFHRKWVKGKKRCVRKHKAHRHKRR